MPPNRLEFKLEINNAGICYMLNTTNHANPNDNLNILNKVISKAKDKHLPVRMIKFSKHKHSKSQWITKGIIRSTAYKDKLYMKLKQTPTDSEQYINHKTNFSTYQRILKKLIRSAKKHIIKIVLKNVRMKLNKHGVLSKKLLIGLDQEIGIS